MKHFIEIIELDQEYSYWNCDCGIAGSCPSFNVEVVAERHIPDNEPAWYRYPSKDSRA
jgi:hypothetical protein